jgi:hypothetical protein
MTASANAQSPTSNTLGVGENEALILQLGEGQRAAIEQRNLDGGLLSGAIKQFGIGNEASILLEGGSLSGSILQDGNDNAATLEVRDRNNHGAIEQYGDANSGGLQIAGEGKDVTLIQQGDVQNQGLPIKIGGDTPSGLPITIRQY